jgi:type II secretion system protein N
MIRSLFKHKSYLGYILYGILLIIGLLYYRFPSDAVGAYLQSTADQISPRYQVSVGKARLSFPIGMKLMKTKVTSKEDPGTNLFVSDSLLIKPDLWSLLKGESTYGFDCQTYGGNITGSVHFEANGIDDPETPLASSIELKGIRIGDYTYFSSLIGRSVKGILEGVVTYKGQFDQLINGTGEANLRISDGFFELLHAVFGLESVGFDDLWIKMVLRKKKITLARVELEGREIRGTLSGTIRLKNEFSESRLALRGSIEPQEDFIRSDKGAASMLKLFKGRLRKGKFNFVIRGTPADPKIRFI